MALRVVPYAASAIIVLAAVGVFGQTPPQAAARPTPGPQVPGSQPPAAAVPNTAPTTDGPEAPVSKVTESLMAKLAAMQRGGGLTADDVARRARQNSPEVVAKQRSIAAADAAIDETKSVFYPQLALE